MVKKTIKQNKKTKKASDPSERQFFWLIIFFVLLILAFLLGPTIYKKTFNSFTYGGVNFEIQKQPQLTFYHGVLSGWIKNNNGTATDYNFYFRTDPRQNNISVNTDLGLSRRVLLSLSPGVEECKSIVLAQPQLANFIRSFPHVKELTSGVNNASVAKTINAPFVNCQNASAGTTVIIIQKSDKPSIDAGNASNCFVLNVGDCQYLETIEKYMMALAAKTNNVSIV